mmetsp:Transcript_151703/g.484874  ORF Transcript_151703/g.484874 Transcript_151703/m.484874 type:complete len:573 (+) Transcript_151703:68-1786(+)
MSSALLALLLVLPWAAVALEPAAAPPEPLDGTCPAGDRSCAGASATATGKYYWANQKGDLNRTGLSAHAVPFDLRRQAPAWRWTDPEPGVIRATPLIDDRLNLYMSTINGRVIKLSPEGSVLWTYRSKYGVQPSVPALMDGLLFGNTEKGWIYALDMETGEEVWAVQASNGTASDTASMFAASGVVVAATMMPVEGRQEAFQTNNALVALSSRDGAHKWTHLMTGYNIYNFQGASPGDGTMVFMDSSGGVYRLNLETGAMLWESGIADRQASFFTTAAAVVGPNDVVYCVSNYGKHHDGDNGIVHAYNLSDGQPLWRTNVTLHAMQAVAIGRLAGSEGLSVVFGIGTNPGYPMLFRMIYRGFYAFPGIFWLLALTSGCFCCRRWRRRGSSCIVSGCSLIPMIVLVFLCYLAFMLSLHFLNIQLKNQPGWQFGLQLFAVPPSPQRIVALDAATGAERWRHELPAFAATTCAGDEEELLPRLFWLHRNEGLGHPICLPDSFSQAVIGGDGTAYVGYQDGRLFALRDGDGDGELRGDGEVSDFQFEHGFQASQAIAPGMLAVVPCGGGVWVWKSA